MSRNPHSSPNFIPIKMKQVNFLYSFKPYFDLVGRLTGLQRKPLVRYSLCHALLVQSQCLRQTVGGVGPILSVKGGLNTGHHSGDLSSVVMPIGKHFLSCVSACYQVCILTATLCHIFWVFPSFCLWLNDLSWTFWQLSFSDRNFGVALCPGFQPRPVYLILDHLGRIQ